ncbi:tRNA dihydrouridine(20/20a) synthase DusA [Candidatus Enterovibrio altilux]|uniref:tRNA-dihydrouridine(20/20a) synthase n=1 Tax=Candidatus Enterovibrio altilux TaxID=1927128 RepID=A0A291BBF3_9GAMM|nr:tRNA dihydrouridine(20/20a) synthase DusA [Candidatus Enterovibrio luxaltus]ATF10359.1 tRNA dihydrouridine synthase A [Candidatus Enterovibrio luxaltus]
MTQLSNTQVTPDLEPFFTTTHFSVAPMLNWTDHHCQHFHRLFSKNTLLYSEMVTTGAMIHGKKNLLRCNDEDHPVALQLGGSNPIDLAMCAKLAVERGYDEINLNVGCPSDRVQNGRFGACLMGEANLVAQCISAMKEVVDIPVTVKTRIGIDDQNSYEFLINFVRIVHERSGCSNFTIHARIAWLSGLSPKENREIPPLNYSRVYQLKKDCSHLTIGINGGIKSLEEAKTHLMFMDGVMIGRAAYQNPYMLAEVDQRLFGSNAPIIKRSDAVKAMFPYIEVQLSNGSYLNHISRHMLGVFQNIPGARQWRRYISENAHKPGSGIEVLETALTKISSELNI